MSGAFCQERKPLNSLTPIDRLFASGYTRCQLAFHVSNASECLTILRHGLERLLATIPLLSHDVVIPVGCDSLDSIKIQPPSSSDVDRVLKIKCHDDPLREALAEAGKDKAHFEQEFMPIDIVPDISRPCPVLVLQVNLHPDGVLLSVATNHMVMDATGMGITIQKFANCCRQLEGAQVDLSACAAEQDLGRAMLLHHLPANLSERGFPEYQVYKDLYAQWGKMRDNLYKDSSCIRTRSFNIAAKDVKTLKSRCNELLPHLLFTESNDPGVSGPLTGAPWVSSSDVVIALIWLSLNRARYPGLANEFSTGFKLNAGESGDVVRAGVPVNIRHRVSPPLPKEYLGNAAILMLVTQTLQTFASPEWMTALCRVAYEIRRALNHMDSDDIRSLLHYIQNEEHPVIFSPYDAADFYVSNWRDMGFYDADFGSKLGKPQHARNPDSSVNGAVFIMPKRTHSESPWEIQVSFTDEVLQRLEQDSMWTKYMHLDSYWP
ncbi:hypothetical protein IFM53868_02447 [Aspergillus udagawae]|uniref:Trichothecene 3-O-acetyltransferase n=1 Tax=Aspergillus udagawae TaxID=91492 RepID=A0ABQ1ACL3_9EURO|nr:hypothetical protein IFM53868_02447 [Aspergillus udagawae]GFG11788.1 hypothetical protein IFM5058_05619 [Aspergillus udagawae]